MVNEHNEASVSRYPLLMGVRRMVGKKGLGLLFVVMLLLLMTACGTATSDKDEESLPAAVESAQSWLAGQLDVPVAEVEVVGSEAVEWTDSCLGLGGPAESCLAALTPGWRVDFEVDGQSYEVRTDEAGTYFRSPQIS
jgi:hypothetical protein